MNTKNSTNRKFKRMLVNILSIFVILAIALANTSFSVQATQPTLPGDWDGNAVRKASVLQEAGGYKMWYDGVNLFDQTQVGLATSEDGTSWMKYSDNPVLISGPEAWDSSSEHAPFVMKDGDLYKMWYEGSDGNVRQLGYATSPDGISWTKYEGNPVLQAGPEGYDQDVAGHGSVLYEDGLYKLWYHAIGDQGVIIAYATSPDGISWSKQGPALLGAPDGWDSALWGPSVLKINGSYWMWYSAAGSVNPSIGLATSENGVDWIRVGDAPVISIADNSIGDPHVIFDGQIFKMWFNNFSDGAIYYAESNDGINWSDPSVALLPATSTYVVNTTDDSDDGVCDEIHCGLREAINAANANLVADNVVFDIPGNLPFTIQPGSALPNIENPVTIDGTTQPGFEGLPVIELDGSNAGEGVTGLVITSGFSTVQGLVINRFSGSGIALVNGGENTIRGNFIGTDVTGMVALGNGDGIWLGEGTSNNMIGGVVPGARNLVSGNNIFGVSINHENTLSNLVQGNYIGTNVNGTGAIPNAFGGVILTLGTSQNRIGGTEPGAGNVISANNGDGVTIVDVGTSGNMVQGNFLGTDVTGMVALGNSARGVFVAGGAADNLIGGTEPNAGNLIAGNGAAGVRITDVGTTDNKVQGNFIGTDITGMSPLGNSFVGVRVSDGAASNVIGGTEDGARNVISGNKDSGVLLDGNETTGNAVQGNYIGTDVTGTTTTGPAGPAVGEYTLTVMPETCPTYPAGTDFDGFVSESDDPLAPWSGISVTFRGTDECGGPEMLGAASLVYRYQLEFAEDTQLTLLSVTGAAFNGPDNVLRVLDENMEVLGIANTFGGNSFQTQYVTLQGVVGTVFYVDEFDTSSTWRFRQSIVINGPTPLGNYGNGVLLASGATDNTVIENLISGNMQNGVAIFNSGTTGNVVQENYIGTDITGTQPLGNAAPGVGIGDQAYTNFIIGNLISGNKSDGVAIFNPGTNGNTLQGNNIGTDVNREAAIPNAGVGVWIGDGASDTVIGGNDASLRNVISGNSGDGISINDSGTTGTIIQGNYIGTDSTGTASLPNMSNGIILVNGTHGNLIGGAESGAGNIISANFGSGVGIFNPETTGNVVQGNYIGTDVTGTTTTGPAGTPVGEPTITVMEACPTYPAGTDIDGFVSQSEDPLAPWSGVSVHFQGTEAGCGSPEMIGAASLIYRYKLEFADITPLESISVSGAAFNGPDSVLRVLDEGMNVIGTTNTFGGNSFVTQYVRLQGVEGTVFYLDEFDTSSSWRFRQSIVINGPLPLGNYGNGVAIADSASGNLLIENLISGNMSDGVGISDPGTTGNILRGNFIGTDANGANALPNSGVGVWIGGADDTIIGGVEVGEGNLISGNAVHGVSINFLETTGTQVLGNYIGTNQTGAAALPNGAGGVFVSASQTWIGGTEPGAGNLISGNTGFGIDFQEAAAENFVQGNLIGTDASGTMSLGNSFSGINFGSGVAGNTIGGTDPGVGNTIAFNSGRGIRAIAEAGSGNAILSNSVFSNGLLGIDLSADGVTLNDPLDQDAGPNGLQNFPVIISVTRKGTSMMINGLLVSAPGTTYRLEFFRNAACDPSGYGEGQTFLGFATVTTNPVGIANFKITLPISLQDSFVTATATDPGGNTSEFAKCVGPVK